MAETLTSLDELKGAVGASETAAPLAMDDTPRAPVRDALGRSYATGKRKDAVAPRLDQAGLGQGRGERQGHGGLFRPSPCCR